MLVAVDGDVNKPGASWYMPGLPSTASDRSIWAGSQTPEDTVSFSRHSRSRAAMGSSLAPPTTAAVVAPMEMPATATGLNPGRSSKSALRDAKSYPPNRPPARRTTAVWTFPFWTVMAHLGFERTMQTSPLRTGQRSESTGAGATQDHQVVDVGATPLQPPDPIS